MTRERCSTCRTLLLWASGRLLCCNVNCTVGHQPAQPELPPKDAA